MKECSTGFYFFEKVQDLPTRGAAAVQHFTINGSLFLTFGNYRGDIHKYKTSSVVYKMDEPTEKFTLYQTLQTRGAHGVEYFSIADKHFLAVASYWDGTYQLNSVVFQWNGRRFVVFQKLPTKELHTSSSSHQTEKNISQWQIVKTKVPTQQSQSSTNGMALSSTSSKR